VWVTGWWPFDPICAILLALNILWSAVSLMRESVGGLMDRADPKITAKVEGRLGGEVEKYGISYHHLRHRNMGSGHWVDLHLVFDDDASVKDAHEVATKIEEALRDELGETTMVTTHLEPERDHERIHDEPAPKRGGV
jgi:cation diffusion facilitator family transporter